MYLNNRKEISDKNTKNKSIASHDKLSEEILFF